MRVRVVIYAGHSGLAFRTSLPRGPGEFVQTAGAQGCENSGSVVCQEGYM